MKTSYAESKGQPVIDWRLRLENVDMKNIDEVRALNEFSKDWPTCACGQQDVRIERLPDSSPRDMRLWTLGCHFACRLSDMLGATLLDQHERFEDARTFALEELDHIERREMELLAKFSE